MLIKMADLPKNHLQNFSEAVRTASFMVDGKSTLKEEFVPLGGRFKRHQF